MISGTLQLLPTPCNKKIKSYEFSVEYLISKNEITLNYHIERELLQLFQGLKNTPNKIVSPFKREDNLWENNCLEFFLKPDSIGQAYLEFNFSLDGKWNVFHFDKYREGKKETTTPLLEKMEFRHLGHESMGELSINLSSPSPLRLNSPLFHGSAILYIDKMPCYFHNLPNSQRPPDFHFFHEA